MQFLLAIADYYEYRFLLYLCVRRMHTKDLEMEVKFREIVIDRNGWCVSLGLW